MVCKHELSHGKIRLPLSFVSFNLSNEGATSFGGEYTLCYLMSEQSASKMEIVALVLLKFVLSVPQREGKIHGGQRCLHQGAEHFACTQ